MRSDFLDLARSRFSVLEYEKKPVEQDKIDRILEAADRTDKADIIKEWYDGLHLS